MNGNSPMQIYQIHVEVRLSQRSSMPVETIRQLVQDYINSDYQELWIPSFIEGWESDSILRTNVEKIVVSESVCPHEVVPIAQCALQVHIYQPTEDSTYEKLAVNPSSDTGEEYTAGTMTELPSLELEGHWESLFYADDVKSRLLNYIYATVGFSDANVDSNIVSWNRVILLHGPPGTGKTSLCRALSQKLSIRLKERYSRTHLFEINSHSLFSRWFSESGKLVQNLFSTVAELTHEEDDFIVLLIDEVESLTAARANALSGTEPSDALRVVNALLTQIDKLKTQKNVLIMATSNLSKAIDNAFVDRADVTEYIDYPPPRAIYEILRSILVELMRKKIVAEAIVPSVEEAKMNHLHKPATAGTIERELTERLSISTMHDEQMLKSYIGTKLYDIATKCTGMSGRTLRKLPVLAHARYIGLTPTVRSEVSKNGVGAKRDQESKRTNGASLSAYQQISMPPTPVSVWLTAMQKVVDSEQANRARFE